MARATDAPGEEHRAVAVMRRICEHSAGMPMQAWTSWRDVAETFTAERPCRDPEGTERVLCVALRGATSVTAFVSAEWVSNVPIELHDSEVPGFGPLRVLRVLDRFVGWLAARGDLPAWSRDVLFSAFDDARESIAAPRRHAVRVKERVVGVSERTALGGRFAATLLPHEQPLGCKVPELIAIHLAAQLGRTERMPLGALDVHAMLELAAASDDANGRAETLSAELGATARFYLWLAEAGELEPARAHAIASQLSGLALGALIGVASAKNSGRAAPN